MRGLRSVCCSSSGRLYLLGCTDQNLGWVVRLEGSDTVHVISSQDLFSKFRQVSVFVRMFVQEEDLYIVGWHMEDDSSDFVLKVTPDGETEVVGRGDGGDLRGLYLGEKGKEWCKGGGKHEKPHNWDVSKLGSVGMRWLGLFEVWNKWSNMEYHWGVISWFGHHWKKILGHPHVNFLPKDTTKVFKGTHLPMNRGRRGTLRSSTPNCFWKTSCLVCNLISTGLSRSFEWYQQLRPLARFVTENRKIYVADAGPVGQVLTYNPGDWDCLRVFDNAPFFLGDKPVDVLVHEGDLYVLFQTGLVYKYAFPPTLDLNYGNPAEA